MTRWLLTSCRRVSLIRELLWLTVGWSKLANRAVRLDRSSSSIERTSGESSTTKRGLTYQKGRVRRQTLFFTIQQVQLLSVTSSIDILFVLRPLNNVVLFTTIKCPFNIRPYFLQKTSSTVVRDVISQWWSFDSIHSKIVFCNASHRIRPVLASAWGHYRCQRLNVIKYVII